MSTDITLPKDREPRFPDKCIVCHQKPDSTVGVVQNGQNPLLVFFMPLLYLFGWKRVFVPSCRGCKLRFLFQRGGRELFCWTLIAITVILYFSFADKVRPNWFT